MEILQNKKYAFSTDNESTAKAKALAVQKLYKMQGSRIDEKKKEFWKVPTLEKSDVNDQCNIMIIDLIFV